MNSKRRPKGAPSQSGVEKGLFEHPEQEQGGFCFGEKRAGGRDWGCRKGQEDKKILLWGGDGRIGIGEEGLETGSLEKGLLWSASFWESWEKDKAKIAIGGFGVTRFRETQGVSNPFLSLITGRGTL